MATKKFIIEVEEGITGCNSCPFDHIKCGIENIELLDCAVINLATMKIKEYEDKD